eukprot:61963_1
MGVGDSHSDAFIAEVVHDSPNILWLKTLESVYDESAFAFDHTFWVPAISNNIAVVSQRSRTKITYVAINISSSSNQSIFWEHQCDTPSFYQSGSREDYTAAIDGYIVFITCMDGVWSFDLRTGYFVRLYRCTGCSGQPIITRDTVIVNSQNGVKLFERNTTALLLKLGSSG